MYHSDEYYRSIIEARDETIYELYNDVDELRTVTELLEDDLQKATDDLQEANKELVEKEKLIIHLTSIINNLNGEISLLKDENRELQSDVILYQRSCMDRN